ncbi:hypothetical protein [Cronobacter condimenti]|uniref:hypothetical protein n=1 Tax=Cronobacter condimenti TaxID=1163710 RepID=UPI0006ACBEFA|nr:hypothetical protein [Cronobacter condimenti]
MRPTRVSGEKRNALVKPADMFLSKIDESADEDDPILATMMDEWSKQVACPSMFSDFREFSARSSAKAFTRMAFNQLLYTRTFRGQNECKLTRSSVTAQIRNLNKPSHFYYVRKILSHHDHI